MRAITDFIKIVRIYYYSFHTDKKKKSRTQHDCRRENKESILQGWERLVVQRMTLITEKISV